jgi:exosortase N
MFIVEIVFILRLMFYVIFFEKCVKSSYVELTGYMKSIANDNVIKFENDNALIYIKPSCHFFGPDHSPTICWKGSGYDFINIKTEKIGSDEIYTAELKKDNEILQIAWWFDN